MLDLNYMSKNEKDIYTVGIMVGYIIGMNKAYTEDYIEDHGGEEPNEEAWLEEIESKIRDIELQLPETIGFEMAEKMFNEFADKVKGN